MTTTQPRTRRIAIALALAAFFGAIVNLGTGLATAHGTASSQVRIATTFSAHGITVDPTVGLVDGIIQGTLRVTNTTGRPLIFEVIGSSGGGKMSIGNVPVSATSTNPESFTVLPYATWLDNAPKGIETFTVRARPVPGAGLSEKRSLRRSLNFSVVVDVNALAPATTPIAFTYNVKSFDGAILSTNFFPASGLESGVGKETLLYPSDLGVPGITDPYAPHGTRTVEPGIAHLRTVTGVGDVAFNVVTWDPRGSFASGGISQFGTAYQEGRDVSALVDWIAEYTPAVLNGASDPAIGILGGGFAGNVALVAGATDPRIDATVPTASWFSMDTAFHHNDIFRSGEADALLSRLERSGARTNKTLTGQIHRGVSNGVVSDSGRAAMGVAGPSINLNQLQAPTFFIQGSNDSVSTIAEVVLSVQRILNNPYGVPVKIAVIDFSTVSADVATSLRTYSKTWFKKYVVGLPIPDSVIPNFQWWDQSGNLSTSSLQLFEAGFNSTTPLTVVAPGGLLKGARKAKRSAVDQLTVPLTLVEGNKIVGAPTLSFTYQGKGSRRMVFARVVDKATGRVVGPLTTPIPVTLDGQQRTVSVALSDIVWTAGSASQTSLEVQIIPNFNLYLRRGSGSLRITNIVASVPIVALSQ